MGRVWGLDFKIPDKHWCVLMEKQPALCEWILANYPKDQHYFLVPTQSNKECTCVYRSASQTKYLYSRYNPRKTDIQASTVRVLLLGVGLGYELEAIYSPERSICVVETDPEVWLMFVSMESNLKFLQAPNVQFYFKDSSEIDVGLRWEIFESANVRIQKEITYLQVYKKAMHRLHETIIVYDYPVFARNLCNAFEELGYSCHLLIWEGEIEARSQWVKIQPKFIVAINHNYAIQAYANRFEIPYVSWTIDSPSFHLMDSKIEHPLTIHFCYDIALVQHLLDMGVSNIEYLPPATVVRNFQPGVKNSIDISFVGNVAFDQNLWSMYRDRLPNHLYSFLMELIDQLSENDLSRASGEVFESIRYEGLVFLDAIWEYVHSSFKSIDYMSTRERVALHLSKEISRQFRIKVMNRLVRKFEGCAEIHIYGNESWVDVLEEPAYYKGYLDELGMARTFNTSKVNLNFIQPQAGDYALPMRVYDVLGSRGFLISNNRPVLHTEFTPSVHLVTTHLDQLEEAIGYYLSASKEREQIKEAGWRKVTLNDTFLHRAKYIVERVKSRHLI